MAPLILQDALQALRRLGSTRFARGLSARLLWVTIGFVMLAEILIFLPSAANYRSQWLNERLQAAELAALAVEAAPDAMVSDELAGELLASAEVQAVALIREGATEVILPGPPPPGAVERITLGEGRSTMGWLQERLAGVVAACDILISDEPRHLLVSAPRSRMGAQARDTRERIEVLLDAAPLRSELFAFSKRILGLSVFISIIAGGAVYFTLNRIFVRPMRKLVANMVRFRRNPEDPARVIVAGARSDEIGQAEAELATLQHEVRQALAQKARLAALGGAVAKINHDLRNVLTSAQLVSDRLAAHSDPKVRGPAERLVRSIDRGVRLAEDVLAYGRAEEAPAQLGPVRLRPVLEDAFYDAVAALERPTGFDLQVGDDVDVLADPEHLHRIFMNLMRNASEVMAAQADRSAPGMLAVIAAPNGALVEVRVVDNGPGVPEAVQERLFEPFSRSTRKDGSGLGLSIARELARAQGGDVELGVTGPDGTTFVVKLRAVQG